jgi:hypothetical protein
MEPLSHNPAAAGVGGAVVANGATGLAAGSVAGVATTAIIPAGVDEVSALAALAFGAEGAQTTVVNAAAQGEVTRAGEAVIEASAVYAQVDEAHGAILS